MFGFGKKKRLKAVCVTAAVLSLACGASIFPHLRKYGLKVDEFATDVKLYGLRPAIFFGE